MHYYNYSYSSQCVDFFIKTRGRGVHLVEKIWPALDRGKAIELFQREQLRWNVYKKLAKLADRLLIGGMDEEIVRINCLKSVEYFKKMIEKEQSHDRAVTELGLTGSKLQGIL